MCIIHRLWSYLLSFFSFFRFFCGSPFVYHSSFQVLVVASQKLEKANLPFQFWKWSLSYLTLLIQYMWPSVQYRNPFAHKYWMQILHNHTTADQTKNITIAYLLWLMSGLNSQSRTGFKFKMLISLVLFQKTKLSSCWGVLVLSSLSRHCFFFLNVLKIVV